MGRQNILRKNVCLACKHEGVMCSSRGCDALFNGDGSLIVCNMASWLEGRYWGGKNGAASKHSHSIESHKEHTNLLPSTRQTQANNNKSQLPWHSQLIDNALSRMRNPHSLGSLSTHFSDQCVPITRTKARWGNTLPHQPRWNLPSDYKAYMYKPTLATCEGEHTQLLNKYTSTLKQ